MRNSLNHKFKTAIRLCREAAYHYSDGNYSGSFISKYTSAASENVKDVKVDRVIYCFWTGDNEMSDNRRRGLQFIRENSGMEVKLITPENLDEFIKPEDPLPECYQYLSHVHKADYLRTYFMHYYGGGYSDIKGQHNSWVHLFDKLESSNAYIMGYHEIGYDVVSLGDTYETRLDLLLYWRMLIGTGAFICRPQTRFTDEWYRETKRRVLQKSEAIMRHPASDPRGSNSDYPVPWMHILGDVFHPLCLKYHTKIIQDSTVRPDFVDYL